MQYWDLGGPLSAGIASLLAGAAFVFSPSPEQELERRIFQSATQMLEINNAPAETAWFEPETGIMVQINAQSGFKADDGRWCGAYIANLAGRDFKPVSRSEKMACRDHKGKWSDTPNPQKASTGQKLTSFQ